MLEWEQFSNKGVILGVDPEKYSGFGVVALARKVSEWPSNDKSDSVDKGVYFGSGRRMYRLEKEGETINIEGLVIPPGPTQKRETPRERANQSVHAMKSITILPNGDIVSGSDRISPHDKRLTVLVSDLIFPTPVKPSLYQENVAKLTR